MSESLELTKSLSGAEVAGLFNPELEEGLSTSERNLLTTLLASDDKIDITIPDDIDAADLWETMGILCKVYYGTGQARTQLKLLIGRALVLIQTMPGIWQTRGYKSFDAFMSDEVAGLPFMTKISRPELYKTKSIGEKIGNLPLEQSRAIGFTKLAMVAQKTEQGNSDFKTWIDNAEKMTIPDLKIAIAESNVLIPAGSTEEVTLTWILKRDEKEAVDSFMADPEVHATCGTDRPGGIMQWLMAEADSAGWRNQCDAGAEKLKELVDAKKESAA